MWLREWVQPCPVCRERTPHRRRVLPLPLLRRLGRTRCERCRGRRRAGRRRTGPTLDGKTEISFL